MSAGQGGRVCVHRGRQGRGLGWALPRPKDRRDIDAHLRGLGVPKLGCVTCRHGRVQRWRRQAAGEARRARYAGAWRRGCATHQAMLMRARTPKTNSTLHPHTQPGARTVVQQAHALEAGGAHLIHHGQGLQAGGGEGAAERESAAGAWGEAGGARTAAAQRPPEPSRLSAGAPHPPLLPPSHPHPPCPHPARPRSTGRRSSAPGSGQPVAQWGAVGGRGRDASGWRRQAWEGGSGGGIEQG